jgi:glutaredoxin
MRCYFYNQIKIKGEKMKKSSVLGALAGVMFIGNAVAADITIYYSPTCPHCHHALEFISNNLIYEYENLNVTKVNVMESANRDDFMAALKKCEYESGGVPVLVIGDKCFQGYGDAMQGDVRAAIEVDLDDAAKSAAAENKLAMEKNADEFRNNHSERASAIVDREIAKVADEDAQKKTKKNASKTSGGNWVLYLILVVLLGGLGFVLTRKTK